jgi:hypothetical protein
MFGDALKRIVSISLILIFLVHFTGFYFYFVLRLVEIHREVRNQLKLLPEEQLQMLELSVAEFQKSNVGDDEVEVNGKMYDVARIEITQENVILYCIQDTAEDNLLSFLDEVLKNAARDKKQLPSGVFAFISQADLCDVLTLPPNSFKQIETSTAHLIHFSSYYPELLAPPPKS